MRGQGDAAFFAPFLREALPEPGLGSAGGTDGKPAAQGNAFWLSHVTSPTKRRALLEEYYYGASDYGDGSPRVSPLPEREPRDLQTRIYQWRSNLAAETVDAAATLRIAPSGLDGVLRTRGQTTIRFTVSLELAGFCRSRFLSPQQSPAVSEILWAWKYLGVFL